MTNTVKVVHHLCNRRVWNDDRPSCFLDSNLLPFKKSSHFEVKFSLVSVDTADQGSLIVISYRMLNTQDRNLACMYLMTSATPIVRGNFLKDTVTQTLAACNLNQASSIVKIPV